MESIGSSSKQTISATNPSEHTHCAKETIDLQSLMSDYGCSAEAFEKADEELRAGKQLPGLSINRKDCHSTELFFQRLCARPNELYIYLRKNPDQINARDERGMTLLHHAASLGAVSTSRIAHVVLDLLSKSPGIDFGIRDSDDNTPVHRVMSFARDNGGRCVFPQFVREAISHGFDCSTKGEKGYTILHLAALNAYEHPMLGKDKNVSKMVDIFIENNVPNLPSVLNTLSNSGTTALFYCINQSSGNNLLSLDEARVLLKAGADPLERGTFSSDRSPLEEIRDLRRGYEGDKKRYLSQGRKEDVIKSESRIQQLKEFENEMNLSIKRQNGSLFQKMETIRLGVDALGPAEGPNSLPTELSQGANKNYQTALEIEARPYLFMNNEADAIPFYEKARDEGVMEAALRLGRIHESHIDDFFTFGKDPRSSAIENYEIAAQSQDTEIRNSAFSAIERLKSDEYSAKKESLRQMAFGLERATLERLSLNNPSQVAKPFGFHDKL